MAIRFALRGNSLNALTSFAGATPGILGASSSTADAGAIGGSKIALSGSNYLSYRGHENLPLTMAISILVRMTPSYSGSPGSDNGIFTCGHDFYQRESGLISFNHDQSGGNLHVYQYGDNATQGVNSIAQSAWSPTAGTYYDLVATYTGDNTSNGFKFYIDGSQVLQTTCNQVFSATRPTNFLNQLLLGLGQTGTTGLSDFGEVVIWDTVINPSSVALVGGTGSLNGASRTSFVAAIAFDGTSNIDPGISKVISGTGYTIAGGALTGTYVPSYTAASNVRSGTNRGDGTTGTLVVPVAPTVLTGIVYDNGTTGTLSSGGGGSQLVLSL